MNPPNRPDENEIEQVQAYFYSLIRDPLSSPPPGLDPLTDELIWRLVQSEQQAANLAQPLFAAARQRLWQRILAQTGAEKRLAGLADLPNYTPEIGQGMGVERNGWHKESGIGQSNYAGAGRKRWFARPRLLEWGRWGLVAGMTATVVLAVGIIGLMLVRVWLGEGQPGEGAAIQSVTAPTANNSGPAAPGKSVIASGKPTTGGSDNKILLQPRNGNADPKLLQATTLLLQSRLKMLAISDVNVTLQQNQFINLEGAGIARQRSLIDQVLGRGLVEIIIVDQEALNDGEAIQTGYCTQGSLLQPGPAKCPASPTGRLNTEGRPFQTIIASDQLGLPDISRGEQTKVDGLATLQNTLSKFANSKLKLDPSYASKRAIAVLDGKVLAALQLDGLFSQGKANLQQLGTPQGKLEITLLTTMLTFGLLPLDLAASN